MIGSPQHPGIMVLTLRDLFLHIQSLAEAKGVQYNVSISFLEVYNENIRDLLSDTEEYLGLREDPIKVCLRGA
jgi:kinesin family protein 18/19